MRLNLGCGEDYRDGFVNVDVREPADEFADLNEPWPWEDASAKGILMSHVLEHLDDVEHALREAERVLEPGGWLDVRVPIGLDFRADPDHKPANEWTMNTPLYYCGSRPWDVDVGLRIAKRGIRLWSQLDGLEHYLLAAYIKFRLWRSGPGRWAWALPATSGEYRVVFGKPPGEP